MTHVTASDAPRGIGRREMIAGAGAALIGAMAIGPGRGVLEVLPFIGDSASPFDRSELTTRIGETFRVASGSAKGAVLEITEIRDLPLVTMIDEIEHQFLVRFRGPMAPALAQDTYTFTTESFGDLPLFITPMSDPGDAAAVYEAIVNRFVPSTATGGRP